MAASENLVDFDIIENQKENIQSLPGGRSARELARIFSPRDNSDKLASPSPNDTRTLNDAMRQEYETELKAIGESDDPLDIYDRYVRWALNAYPSAQATPESGLLPLLERAVRAFLSSTHYRNDPRYLRLWLHYIRLFSDAPRETFAFLARHHIGEGLALFYEEFAAWLESVGRWNQADEVYRLGMDREARPVERLARKYDEFQHRFQSRTQDNGPSSPALPTVRPVLAAKVDPFAASSSSSPAVPQAQRLAAASGPSKPKSGKPKMAIFSDSASGNEPALSEQSKGWESIGSLQERKKENQVEAKPWVGETLKAGKKSGPTQKMAIFRDESNLNSHVETMQSKHVPEHRVREAVNPRTGRRERVFVDLEAVYPDYKNPNHEVSFEELRAISRGWGARNWRAPKEPLKEISGNASSADTSPEKDLPEQFEEKLSVKGAEPEPTDHGMDHDGYEGKAGKARKLKLREVKGETQTVKMNFASPSKNKVRRKSTAEPTMTMHTRAATDEIYDIFNQPLMAEDHRADDSDFDDDDDCASVPDTTVTGQISVASSDFADDETQTLHRDYEDTTRGSMPDGEWTEYSASRDMPAELTRESATHDEYTTEPLDRERYVPEMPDDYNPPTGMYRDPEVMAQNRLPFMTPIVEQTEHSLASMTAARNSIYNAKTPSKPMLNSGQTPTIPEGDLLSPLPGAPHNQDGLTGLVDDLTLSPTAKKARSSPRTTAPPEVDRQQSIVIDDAQCNPMDTGIRKTIVDVLSPPLGSYDGYHAYPEDSNHAFEIQKFMKTNSKRPKSGDDMTLKVPILEFARGARSYIIRRELGEGAYAPVYLAESVDSLESYPSSDSESEHTNGDSQTKNKLLAPRNTSRYGFEAVKLEIGPPSAWEFYMIRTAHGRLTQRPDLSRAAASIIRAHELHVFKKESFLIEDYRGQGTLLDLVNIIRNEPITSNSSGEAGLDEALAMFFTVELLRTVEALHTCGILHGDIKADNCLIRFDDSNHKPTTPSTPLIGLGQDQPREAHYSPRGAHGWHAKGLSLIDFGRSIDMHAFRENVQFIADWEPSTYECNEIRETRPWTHQIDLYGIAGTVHVMLFGKYLESTSVRKSEGPNQSTSDSLHRAYRIRETLKRYWDREIWADVFDLLLNPGAERWVAMEGPESEREAGKPVFPVLKSMRYLRGRMEGWLVANAEKKGLGLQIRKLEGIFAEKRRRAEKR